MHVYSNNCIYRYIATSTNDSGIVFDIEGLFIYQHMDGEIKQGIMKSTQHSKHLHRDPHDVTLACSLTSQTYYTLIQYVTLSHLRSKVHKCDIALALEC